MGKIVKYCNSCNESFAEKFGFCPNCGEKMQAFEMNPVKNELSIEEPKIVEPPKTVEPPKMEAPRKIVFKREEPTVVPLSNDIYESVAEDKAIPETNAYLTPEETLSYEEPILELDTIDEPKVVKDEPKTIEVAPETYVPRKPKVSEPQVKQETSEFETETFIPGETEKAVGEENGEYYSPYNTAENNYQEVRSIRSAKRPDKDFHVAILKEKNTQQRNLLLLGSLLFMVTLSFGAVIYSLFNFNLDIASIDEDMVAIVPIIEETPMTVKEEIQQKKDKDAGGGGGGGRDENQPTSKGRLAPQTREPILITPTKTIVQRTNPELKIQAFTEGDERPEKKTDERYGDPTSKYSVLSDGKGSGGGQGSGTGSGQGSGSGTGRGSGTGSGSGGGIGRGNGDGEGDGTQSRNREVPKPDPKPVGISRDIQIISKPQARYTEEARKNAYQGSVTLRVTFLANGQVGSVAPVSRLPHGLTEQAIAAAKRIQFNPAMRNGQPVSSQKRIQYSFTIY